jgi:N-methylhydantoinase A
MISRWHYAFTIMVASSGLDPDAAAAASPISWRREHPIPGDKRSFGTVDELRIAADVGGTFTDIAVLTPAGLLATQKVPSTPPDFAEGVLSGILTLLDTLKIHPSRVKSVLHGCTVATNAILEGRGAKTALLTTKGFRDVLELRRIRIPKLYDPHWRKPPPLVPRQLRLEVRERVAPDGRVLVPMETADIREAVQRIRQEGVEAVAVCYLHSYLNPDHERRTGEILEAELDGLFVTLSCDILPEIREYERTSTTVINAYIGPAVRHYIASLIDRLRAAGISGHLLVMQSNGGMIDSATVLRQPVNIVECGPAAGVIGALRFSATTEMRDLITLDMGGTTAKASIVEDGRILTTDEYEVGGGISASSPLVKGGGYALKMPVIDISEVGAGGGSIIWIDKAGHMRVGPQSAGSRPGPVCYDGGGVEPTLTDANLVLGYLNQRALAGGTVAVDVQKARAVLQERIASRLGLPLLETAYGVHIIANAAMIRAVKSVTTYRGRDPRTFVLLAFGGNGGIHGAELARAMQVPRVIVPAGAGIFSAVGLLVADVSITHSAAFLRDLGEADPAAMQAIYDRLEHVLSERLGRPRQQLRFFRQAELRYIGQAFELTVGVPNGELVSNTNFLLAQAFEDEHQRTYGHRFSGRKSVQIVTLRLTATVVGDVPTPLGKPASSSADPPRGTARNSYFGREHGNVLTPVIGRSALTSTPRKGPLIVEEYEGTIVIPPRASARLDHWGNVEIDIALRSP